MKIRTKQFSEWALISLAWLAGFLSLIGRATRDVNPHHDGVILAPAIAVAEGKTPNLDVFSQYGFLIPYIQGVWLRLTGITLLNLRILTLIEVLATAIILYFVLRDHIGSLVAHLVSCAWIVSYPHLLPFLPWPSVTSTLFLVSAITSLSRIRAGNRHRAKLIYIAFLFLCLATLVRPQTAIIAFVVGIYFLGDTGKSVRLLSTRVLILAAFPLAIITLAISNNFFGDYMSQSILWASSNYGSLGFTIRGLAELFVTCFVGGAGFLALKISLHPDRKIIATSIWLMLAVLCVLLLRYFTWTYKDFPYFAVKHPKVLLADIGLNSINTLSFVAFLVLIAGIFKMGRVKILQTSLQMDAPELIVILSGFTILQLYPATDPLHFWWISPIFILGAFFSFKGVKISNSSKRVISIALGLYILLCTLNFTHYQGELSTPYKSPILKGMSGPILEVQFIDKSIALLNALPPKSRVKFDCADGIYSVATGRYMPQDENFVNWATNFSKSKYDSEFIFECNVENQAPSEMGYRVWKTIHVKIGESGSQNNIVNRLLIKENDGG